MKGESATEKSGFVGEKTLEFVVTDIKGNTYTLQELKGKVVVLNFWFTAGKPCRQQIAELNKLVKKYQDNNIVFFGVSLDEKEKITSFIKHVPFNYNLVPQGKSLAKDYMIKAYPTHIVINKNSEIVYAKAGYTNKIVHNFRY